MLNYIEPIPLDLNDTDILTETEDELDSISKPINSFNISACGYLKFNRSSQSNASTLFESKAVLSNVCSNIKSAEKGNCNIDKYKKYNIINTVPSVYKKKSNHSRANNRNTMTFVQFKIRKENVDAFSYHHDNREYNRTYRDTVNNSKSDKYKRYQDLKENESEHRIKLESPLKPSKVKSVINAHCKDANTNKRIIKFHSLKKIIRS